MNGNKHKGAAYSQEANDQSDPIDPPFDATQAVMRVLIGCTLEGFDELTRRLQHWEIEVLRDAKIKADDSGATEHDRLRYALIGLLFITQYHTRRSVSHWLAFSNQTAQSVVTTADRLSDHALLRPFADPLKRYIHRTADNINAEFERWVQIGDAEEELGRAVARRVVDEIVSEVITELADNPELRDVVHQQSIGLAGEVVDGVRKVTVSADAVLEGIVRRILNRQPRKQLPLRLLPENDNREPDNDAAQP